MKFCHLTLDARSYERVFVVGDIHGKLSLLKSMLKQVAFSDQKDILISVGDLIDRGPDSAGVLEFYHKQPWFYAVAGNHELLMADVMRFGGPFHIHDGHAKRLSLWYRNGGDWVLQESEYRLRKLHEIITKMPCAITVLLASGKKVGISHAQPHSLNWQEMQNWQGDIFEKPRWIWGRTRIQGDPPGPIKGVDYTIHGHTATRGVERVANSLFIDTASKDSNQSHFTFFELNSEAEFNSIRQDQLGANNHSNH